MQKDQTWMPIVYLKKGQACLVNHLNMIAALPQQIIDEAVAIANQSDVIVAALGESAEMTGESSSRSNIEIPGAQKDLLKALLKTGKPLVLVLFTGQATCIEMGK